MYLSDPTNQAAKMVHGEPDYDDDDMLPEMSQAEIDYRNKMAELQYANYLHEKQQKEFHYKGNLRNALLSLSNKLRDYVDAVSAIPELSAAVMRWKAAATPECKCTTFSAEACLCASLKKREMFRPASSSSREKRRTRCPHKGKACGLHACMAPKKPSTRSSYLSSRS